MGFASLNPSYKIMKPIVAIATGDPAGIGPEISLKAALDPSVRSACRPLLVSDARSLARHAKACGLPADLRVIDNVTDADWSGAAINVLDCVQPEAAALDFGATDAASGRASIAFVEAAIKAALAGEVNAVVAAPQNETSVALAGIPSTAIPRWWHV
jgi:4-hydroxy-L-threonine phosphate dehydrogenase PdxA